MKIEHRLRIQSFWQTEEQEDSLQRTGLFN